MTNLYPIIYWYDKNKKIISKGIYFGKYLMLRKKRKPDNDNVRFKYV